MDYRILSHTADSGAEATAPTLGELIATLATAMFELMGVGSDEPGAAPIDLSVESAGPEDLVVDSLSELLYLSEERGMALGGFAVSAPDARHAEIRCHATPWAETEITGPPVKAVTYHGLAVEERPGGWYGRVYFDV